MTTLDSSGLLPVRESPRVGYADDLDLGDAELAALRDAERALEPFGDNPALGALLERVRGYQTPRDDESIDALEKGLHMIDEGRQALATAAEVGEVGGLERVRLQQQLAKSEKALQHEIMLKGDTGGYRAALAGREAEEATRRRNLAGRAA
jgi:hypothetical protein